MSDPDRKPWFGPHRYGYGWGPVSWQGWVVTAAIALAAAGPAMVLAGALVAITGHSPAAGAHPLPGAH